MMNDQIRPGGYHPNAYPDAMRAVSLVLSALVVGVVLFQTAAAVVAFA